MHKSASLAVVIVAISLPFRSEVRAEGQTFVSKAAKTHLLELFTSEGCSSCPPAEKWLGELKEDGGLWRDFVPVAFHVDYWDNLGWRDRFAQSEWTRRQRAYASRWNSPSVYTPAFVLDGQEWQDWGRRVSDYPSENAGVLAATVNGNIVAVTFQSGLKSGSASAHVAWLGFDLVSQVNAGENSGRSLRHDFVVLAHASGPLTRDPNGNSNAEITASTANDKVGAIAFWIEVEGVPIQATGGWLKNRREK